MPHWFEILFKQKLVKAVNNLVEKDELVAWSRIKEGRREHTITKLLHVVEESALTLGSNYQSPTELEIKATEMGEAVYAAECLHTHSSYIFHLAESQFQEEHCGPAVDHWTSSIASLGH